MEFCTWQEKGSKRLKNWLYPHSTLQVESTRRCNLNCQMCMRQNLNETNALLSFKDFKKALNSWMFHHVALHGWGEPLLNPELFQMIKYAESQGISTELTTNGTLLRNNIEEIFVSGLRTIVFGVSNKKILPVILPQIKNLVKQKNKNRLRNPKIYIDVVIYKENLNQILDLVEAFSQLSINGIVLHRLFNVYKVDPDVEYISIQEEEELFGEVSDLAERLTIKLYLPPEPSLPCEVVKHSIFVTAEGKVTPCPFLPQFYMGDVVNSGIKGTLYSEKYFNFITNMNENPVCTKCPLGSSNAVAFSPEIWPAFQQEEAHEEVAVV